MLDALLRDLRYAIRALRSGTGFAAVAILSPALGIGANTAIFSLVNAVTLKYLPYDAPKGTSWNPLNSFRAQLPDPKSMIR